MAEESAPAPSESSGEGTPKKADETKPTSEASPYEMPEHVRKKIENYDNINSRYKNDPHFQIGGWNVGLETALRATVYRYAYLEFAQKVDYARYSNLKILGGTARQAFGTYEFILSLGFIVPTTKHNPMFAKQVAEATAGQ